jgi:hypothetical protein
MIVPTGIGCEIGGHCGDGNAPARLLGACCGNLVLHPNVVNASDINEMPANALYVEGNHLDRFLQGKLFLQKVRSNKVLVVVNKADYQSINAVSAARLIGEALDKPCAHGPVDYALTGFKEVVDPRIAVEIVTENFIHCLLKGLHKAPRLSTSSGMSNRDVDCMVSPYGCFGAPHQACLDAGIPVIVVRENKSCLNVPEHPKFIYVENYIEAAGMIMAMKAGVHPSTVRRPLAHTVVRKA